METMVFSRWSVFSRKQKILSLPMPRLLDVPMTAEKSEALRQQQNWRRRPTPAVECMTNR